MRGKTCTEQTSALPFKNKCLQRCPDRHYELCLNLQVEIWPESHSRNVDVAVGSTEGPPEAQRPAKHRNARFVAVNYDHHKLLVHFKCLLHHLNVPTARHKILSANVETQARAPLGTPILHWVCTLCPLVIAEAVTPKRKVWGDSR